MKKKRSLCSLGLILCLLASPVLAKDTSISAKIIGGEEADPQGWHWMTALVYRDQDAYYGQFCGASLIDEQWVVTAAHCIEGRSADELDVVINQHDLTIDSGERIQVAAIFQHERYNTNTMDSDIALLLLASPSNQVPIEPVPARDPERLTQPFTQATVLGWGDTTPGNGEYPEVLMAVDVPILPPVIGKMIYQDAFTLTMMAAGPRDGGADTCYGDSGGPLIIPNSDYSDYVLAGITSWGYGCAEAGSPGVYTRVSRFTAWIDQTIDAYTP